MRAIVMIAIVAAACGGSKGETLKLGHPPEAVGDTVTTHQDRGVQAMLQGPSGQVQVMVRDLSDETLEVLEVDGAGRATRAKVTYTSASTTMTALSEREERSPATTGNSYLIWRDGDTVKASRPDGSAPSDEELALVLADHQYFGRGDPMQRQIEERTWRRGERVAFSAEQLEGASMRGTRFTSLVMTLRRVDGGIATFEMHLGLATRNASQDHRATVSGTMQIEVATGRLVEMAGGGPIEGRMDGVPFTGQATLLVEQR